MVKSRIKSLVLNHYDRCPDPLLKRLFRSVVIEPIAGCNLKCPACPCTHLRRDKGIMDFRRFRRIVDSISKAKLSIKRLILYYMGEPFLNPEIFEMIGYAKSRNFTTQISTNGTTLHEDHEKIVKSGLDEIIVSLDGFNEEGLNRYRVGSCFDEIKEGVERLCLRRSERKSGIRVTIKTLVFKHVEPHLEEIREFSTALGADELCFVKPIIGMWGDRENHMELPSAEWRRPSLVRDKPEFPCFEPFVPVITWNGELLPCCFDAHGESSLGNVLDSSFAGLFWGDEGKAVRKDAFHCNLSICPGCQSDKMEDKIVRVR